MILSIVRFQILVAFELFVTDETLEHFRFLYLSLS
jgi:hypothetical protein